MVTHRRGPWSQAEDRILIDLVQRRGPHNWVKISHDIQSRSPKQCRERYHQNLKPNLNHNPISPEEGEAIERMVAEMGKKWAEIARRLNGRSDNAVKNWWNGGQHRRKRNPERRDHHQEIPTQPLHSAYPYSAPPHHHEQSQAHHGYAHPALPPIRDSAEAAYYSQSRRPSLNPSAHSPNSIKLPHPQRFDVYPGSRPQPLQLPPYPSYPNRGGGYETPLPSPGHSIASIDAPSLITDNGSESRSPRGALSPFAEHSAHYDNYRRRSSVQLPPLSATQTNFRGAPLTFREPESRAGERTQLLTQPAPLLVHQQASALSPALPAGQNALPPYQGLSLPPPQTTGSPATSPSSRQLPLPGSSPVHAGESRSAPASPRRETGPRDNRMRIDNIL